MKPRHTHKVMDAAVAAQDAFSKDSPISKLITISWVLLASVEKMQLDVENKEFDEIPIKQRLNTIITDCERVANPRPTKRDKNGKAR